MPKTNVPHPVEVPYYGPKSICYCGHSGDGLYSEHEDRISPGHGACKHTDCPCRQFTWKEFKPEFKRAKGVL